jgi:hypothetical protein
VLKNLTQWEKDREAKIGKNAELAANFSEKKRHAEEKRKQAKIDDAKWRGGPSSRSSVHTLESLKAKEEEGGGGGRAYNMDKTNRNKTNLIPQEYELMKVPKTAEGKSGKSKK